MQMNVLDDPAPPEPDAVALVRTLVRGEALRRRRTVRLRAVMLVSMLGIAFIAVAGVRQLTAPGPIVTVQGSQTPPTVPSTRRTLAPTEPSPAVTARVAAAAGLRFRIMLVTPTVRVRGTVRVDLRVDNGTSRGISISACTLGDIVLLNRSGHAPHAALPCALQGLDVQPGGDFIFHARTEAPSVAGRYRVIAQPLPANSLPTTLLSPLDVIVTP